MPIVLRLFYFVLLLGGLVFVHELGHFMAAKFFKVKVLKFSLGFGTRLWGFTRGETEYQIAALPLGGYVKMAGEDPSAPLAPEDRGRGFFEQAPYKRAIIAFAGPAMNLLLPPLVFCAINMVPQQKEPPVIGIVLPNEPAERAGVQPGDRVLSVDGVPTRSFDDMREEIEARPGQAFDLVVDRHGQQVVLHVTPSVEKEDDVVETVSKGKIGVMVGKLPAYVGVVPGSRAYNAGLRTFDLVASIDGQTIGSSADLDAALKPLGNSAFTIGVVRGEPVDLKTTSISTARPITLSIPAGSDALGVDRPDLYVREVTPDSEVSAKGLRPLDKIVSVNGTPVYSGVRLDRALSEEPADAHEPRKPVTIGVERGAQHFAISFTPVTTERRDPLAGRVPVTEYGFEPHPRILMLLPFTPSELVTVSDPPAKALRRGVTYTVLMTRRMVLGIAAIFQRKVSAETIGGPILLFQLASAAAENGLAKFLEMFALISINLGLMNLIPFIPVLDGFQIVIAGMEGISRRPVPMRARLVAQYVGVVLVLMLMVLAFRNDLVRVFGL